MKKLVLGFAIAVFTLPSFAALNAGFLNCTAHYTLKVFNEDGENYRTIVVHNTAGDCKTAMAQAKELAWDQL